jgi:hypothetical protein
MFGVPRRGDTGQSVDSSTTASTPAPFSSGSQRSSGSSRAVPVSPVTPPSPLCGLHPRNLSRGCPLLRLGGLRTGSALSMLSDEEEGSGCGGPGRCLTRNGVGAQKSARHPTLLGVLCWASRRQRQTLGGAVLAGPPFRGGADGPKTDQIRSVNFQGVTNACSAIGAGSMAMLKVSMGS